MLHVFTKVWYTAMTNGNCGNRTVVKLNMVWCLVVYCVQLPVCWIFCLPWLFSLCVCHSPSQSWTSSIGLVSLESRSWSWTSWSWSWNCWVLVFEPQSLGLGLGLGEAILESKSDVYFLSILLPVCNLSSTSLSNALLLCIFRHLVCLV